MSNEALSYKPSLVKPFCMKFEQLSIFVIIVNSKDFSCDFVSKYFSYDSNSEDFSCDSSIVRIFHVTLQQ